MKLTPGRFIPKSKKRWKAAEDGEWREFHHRTPVGIVEVFSCNSGVHGRAFTSLSMFLWPFEYHLRLPRRCHDNWLARLANAFSAECVRLNRKRRAG